jgi:hypothetical protein
MKRVRGPPELSFIDFFDRYDRLRVVIQRFPNQAKSTLSNNIDKFKVAFDILQDTDF